MGDGTKVLSEEFPNNKILGIDYSSEAIKVATQEFPNIRFLTVDLLSQNINEIFDVFFSSNTLEHFTNPWETIKSLKHYAAQYIILLVPYKEYNRHEEHFYTFDENSISPNINSSFNLVHLSIIDGRDHQPSFWENLQVLLVYSNKKNEGDSTLTKISRTEIRLIELSFLQHKLSLNSSIATENLSTIANQTYDLTIDLKRVIESSVQSNENLTKAFEEQKVFFESGQEALKKQLTDISGTLEDKGEQSLHYKIQEIVELIEKHQHSVQRNIELEAKCAELSNQKHVLEKTELNLNYFRKLSEDRLSYILTQNEDNKRLDEENKFLKARLEDSKQLLESKNTVITEQQHLFDAITKEVLESRETIKILQRLEDEKDKELTILKKEISAKFNTEKELIITTERLRVLTEKYRVLEENTFHIKQAGQKQIDALKSKESLLKESIKKIEWYRKTFEDRSLLGVIKSKLTQKQKR